MLHSPSIRAGGKRRCGPGIAEDSSYLVEARRPTPHIVEQVAARQGGATLELGPSAAPREPSVDLPAGVEVCARGAGAPAAHPCAEAKRRLNIVCVCVCVKIDFASLASHGPGALARKPTCRCPAMSQQSTCLAGSPPLRLWRARSLPTCTPLPELHLGRQGLARRGFEPSSWRVFLMCHTMMLFVTYGSHVGAIHALSLSRWKHQIISGWSSLFQCDIVVERLGCQQSGHRPSRESAAIPCRISTPA